MPSKSLKPCALPHCGKLTSGYYCEDHVKKDTDTRLSAHQRGYDGKWRKYRDAFLSRHPFCKECEMEGRHTVATDVDHIVPHRGDRKKFWDSQNHQSLCHSHHSRKTQRENQEGKAWSRK